MSGNKGAWTGAYWKHGELAKLDSIAKTRNYKYRTGKEPCSPEVAIKLAIASKLIGKDLNSQDWMDASMGNSQHEAFQPVYADRKIWGMDYWEDEIE